MVISILLMLGAIIAIGTRFGLKPGFGIRFLTTAARLPIHVSTWGEAPDCPACGGAQPEREFPTSAAVSTARMRERSLAVARGKAGLVKKEKDHAHAQYLREHAKDHGG